MKKNWNECYRIYHLILERMYYSSAICISIVQTPERDEHQVIAISSAMFHHLYISLQECDKIQIFSSDNDRKRFNANEIMNWPFVTINNTRFSSQELSNQACNSKIDTYTTL